MVKDIDVGKLVKEKDLVQYAMIRLKSGGESKHVML